MFRHSHLLSWGVAAKQSPLPPILGLDFKPKRVIERKLLATTAAALLITTAAAHADRGASRPVCRARGARPPGRITTVPATVRTTST